MSLSNQVAFLTTFGNRKLNISLDWKEKQSDLDNVFRLCLLIVPIVTIDATYLQHKFTAPAVALSQCSASTNRRFLPESLVYDRKLS